MVFSGSLKFTSVERVSLDQNKKIQPPPPNTLTTITHRHKSSAYGLTLSPPSLHFTLILFISCVISLLNICIFQVISRVFLLVSIV